MKKITCQICGEQCHAIAIHLRDSHHAESSEPCTLPEYQSRFPEAELMSEVARQRLADRKQSTPLVETKSAPVITGSKSTVAKLFDLEGVKEAKTKSGKDIMVSMCSPAECDLPLVPEYDNNYVYNIEALKTILMAIETNVPVYVYGHAGVGKSTIYEQICAATKRCLLRIQHSIGTEESHIVGQWTVKKHKDADTGELINETIFELGPLAQAMKNGWVYLADEYDRGHPNVLSIYQAVLEGKPLVIKEADAENRIIRPHPDFRFVATGNTNGSGDESGQYQATVMQDAATFERFSVVMKMEYMSAKQEIAIVRAQANLVEQDARKIVDFCTKIRDQYPTAISLTIGPRVAINIAKIGLMRGDFKKGIELAFANRLPESEREAALSTAQRLFG